MAVSVSLQKWVQVVTDAAVGSKTTAATVSADFGTRGAIDTMNTTSTVAVSKTAAGRITLSGGAATLNLVLLPDFHGTADQITLNGLKPRVIVFSAAATNTALVLVATGASSGYPIFGGNDNSSVNLVPGAWIMCYQPESASVSDVAAGDVAIDFTSVDADAIVDYYLAAG